jgi:CDGSH-type Zn-finger protein
MKDPKEPFHLITEQAGETLYCACGKSKTKPYCDGSHGGTGISPWRMVLPVSRQVKICGCGKTGIGPFCDDSHGVRRAAKDTES